MARRYDQYGNNPGALRLDFSLTIGATGAVTDTEGKGATIARSGTGEYTVTLEQGAAGHYDFRATSFKAANVPLWGKITTDSISSGSFIFTMYDNSGSATDPASGQLLEVSFALKTKNI